MSSQTKQVGEVEPKLSWIEPSVWTNRMLTALENGVKGGKWFGLIDKVYLNENLRSAFDKVKQNQGGAGVDHIDIRQFKQELDKRLFQVQEQLTQNRYVPQKIRRVWIPKPESHENAEVALSLVKEWISEAELILHPDKTHIVDASIKGGFNFLGYHFERGFRLPSK